MSIFFFMVHGFISFPGTEYTLSYVPPMQIKHRRQTARIKKRQLGVTLVELLVATAISLIAIAGMVALMSSTLGATSTTVTTARLSSELRAARQIISRDIRRADYSDDFATCIGSGDAGACLEVPKTLSYTETDASCISFRYERNGAQQFSAVRLNTTTGALEFRSDAASCDDSNNWEALNDPEVITVTRFTVSDDEGFQQALVSGLTQLVRKIRIEIVGEACLTTNCSEKVTREVSHVIRIRNDILE